MKLKNMHIAVAFFIGTIIGSIILFAIIMVH